MIRCFYCCCLQAVRTLAAGVLERLVEAQSARAGVPAATLFPLWPTARAQLLAAEPAATPTRTVQAGQSPASGQQATSKTASLAAAASQSSSRTSSSATAALQHHAASMTPGSNTTTAHMADKSGDSTVLMQGAAKPPAQVEKQAVVLQAAR